MIAYHLLLCFSLSVWLAISAWQYFLSRARAPAYRTIFADWPL